MGAKLFIVTKEVKPKKSKVMGFVTVFGWESPQKKAEAKYPELGEIQIHEK